jgi:chemotaxis protein CheD
MSHFVLATRGGECARDCDIASLNAKYGDEALRLMLRELARRKVGPEHCQAKVFGGGDMFPSQKTCGAIGVGRRNGEAARALLQAEGIRVLSESLFGTGHRHIVFDIGLGHVWSRQVQPCADGGASFSQSQKQSHRQAGE